MWLTEEVKLRRLLTISESKFLIFSTHNQFTLNSSLCKAFTQFLLFKGIFESKGNNEKKIIGQMPPLLCRLCQLIFGKFSVLFKNAPQ